MSHFFLGWPCLYHSPLNDSKIDEETEDVRYTYSISPLLQLLPPKPNYREHTYQRTMTLQDMTREYTVVQVLFVLCRTGCASHTIVRSCNIPAGPRWIMILDCWCCHTICTLWCKLASWPGKAHHILYKNIFLRMLHVLCGGLYIPEVYYSCTRITDHHIKTICKKEIKLTGSPQMQSHENAPSLLSQIKWNVSKSIL